MFTLLPGKQTQTRCCVCEIGEITALFYESGLWQRSRVRLLPDVLDKFTSQQHRWDLNWIAAGETSSPDLQLSAASGDS